MSEKEYFWWQKQRTKGKWFWIFRATFFWFFCMLLFFLITDWFYQHPFSSDFYIIPFLLIGCFLGGLISWWDNESKYQSYLLDKKIENGLKL